MPQVKLYGLFRKHAASSKVDILGGTVRVVLTTLCANNQSLCEAMFDENGLRPHVCVMVNGRDVNLLQGLDTNLTNSDQIAIFPPIAGGS